MPELPEVETIVGGLKGFLIGQKISSIKFLDRKRFVGDEKKIIGQKILDIKRRAKLIIIKLENNQNIVIHLKMTGQLIFKDKTHRIAGGHQSRELFIEVPNIHTRIIFDLSGGGKLFYNDLIRYGTIRVLKDDEVDKMTKGEFGPEPFSDEFNKEYLSMIAQKNKSSNIKKILMDQALIAGVGNIYANEALYLAGIDPSRKSASLSEGEISSLYNAILQSLKLGVKQQGASIRNYVNHEGKKGTMQNYFKVYDKAGQKCDCGGLVKKIQLNGRGTYYCPACQS
ncbi:MAG: bifunctional DNA-formamidopyrimidine glycosylase/DNA-(apurinic or apyrimidinic site) lyase [Candidatus Berkelbacteria bacterium]|nr:bifunctional DNA-formamidopyrimidine glycosylase/DNA-(apurinic or apyrimidinic site) lyase [Candidatus Berkelbacteria bacterium]